MLTPFVVYALGVVVGLWRVDAEPMTRVVLALLWPLGVAAALVTIGALILSAMILFPAVGAAGLLIAAAAWWLAG